MATAKKTAAKKPELIFVGRGSNFGFLRTFEEPSGDADEHTYEVFTHPKPPTKRSHGNRFDLVIGPFQTMRGAEIFRDEFGVNSVEEAERMVQ